MNMIAVMFEDKIDAWPAQMRAAHTGESVNGRPFRDGDFHFGKIMARVAERDCVLVAAGGNMGGLIEDEIARSRASRRKKDADEVILRDLRLLLLGHGYYLRRPGRSRAEGPLGWGYAGEIASGKATPPETSSLICGPGAGVAVLLVNDEAHEWPNEMRTAMNAKGFSGHKGSFGYGQIVSVAHNSYVQTAGICGAGGQMLSCSHQVDDRFLKEAALVLRGQGYATRAPGEKGYAEPIFETVTAV
ncbi:hypothetical protein ACOI1H_16135 [Loktanella sp. DJP18]|uniref:hypothetical protein n=1 Tax=Loktanella sp. DJP18 TaxID=3409788 RepID=UPI003BB72E55